MPWNAGPHTDGWASHKLESHVRQMPGQPVPMDTVAFPLLDSSQDMWWSWGHRGERETHMPALADLTEAQ